MKLELNKRYISRAGIITGQLEWAISSLKETVTCPYRDPLTGKTFRVDGHFSVTHDTRDDDLVEEYPEQPENPESRIENLDSRILQFLLEYTATNPLNSDAGLSIITELESRISQPAELATPNVQAIIDAAIAYPVAMSKINDEYITAIERDGDSYYVTTVTSKHWISPAGELFTSNK